MRIALVVEYDGSQYHGWQAQTGLHTIQQAVEFALSKVADSSISVICAGRTDTGVHATNQVIHFDCEKERSIRAWIHGANTFLPKDICVKWGKEMPENFHARYSAISRRYRYVIYNGAIRPGLLRSNVTWQYRQLDHRLMHQGGNVFLGKMILLHSVLSNANLIHQCVIFINCKLQDTVIWLFLTLQQMPFYIIW